MSASDMDIGIAGLRPGRHRDPSVQGRLRSKRGQWRRRVHGLAAGSLLPGKNLGPAAGGVTRTTRHLPKVRCSGPRQQKTTRLQGYNGRLDTSRPRSWRIKLRRFRWKRSARQRGCNDESSAGSTVWSSPSNLLDKGGLSPLHRPVRRRGAPEL